MKRKLILPLFALTLLTSSCKDEEAHAKIKELEEQVTSLEMERNAITEELKNVRPKEGSLDPQQAAALKAQVTELTEKVYKLSEFEGKYNNAIQELTAMKTAAIPPGTPGVASAVYDEKGELQSKIANAVAIIEGDKKSGSGFVVQVDGAKYLYTAAHNFSGNSKLSIRSSDGTKFSKFGTMEAADGADLVRMQLLDEVKDFLEISTTDLGENALIAALGTETGSSVVKAERGQFSRVEGDALELVLSSVLSASGGPVVELAGGKVVGLSSQLPNEYADIWSGAVSQVEPRPYTCRLNKKWVWKPVSIGTFLAEPKLIDEFDKVTRLCVAMSKLIPTTTGISMDAVVGGNLTAKSVLDQNSELPLVQALIKLNTELAGKKIAVREEDVNKKFAGLLGDVIAMAKRSETTLKPATMSWYHRARYDISAKARASAMSDLDTSLESLKP